MKLLPQTESKIEVTPKRTKPIKAQLNLVASLISNIHRYENTLPATMTEIWAVGNALRCDETAGIDLLAVYSMNPSQRASWDWLEWMIGDGGCVPDEIRDTMCKFRQPFRDALERELEEHTFDEALRTPAVSVLAEEVGLKVDWAACFSRSEYFHGEPGDGLFFPRVEKVLRRQLVGRLSQRGLRVQFYRAPFIQRMLRPEYELGCRKIWEPGTSVEQVLNNMSPSPEDRETALESRLSQITEQMSRKLQDFNQSGHALAKDASKKHVHLDVDKFYAAVLLLSSDMTVTDPEEKYKQLEQALELLEQFDLLAWRIHKILERKWIRGTPSFMKELLGVFGSTAASEAETRRLVKLLGLPEHEYVIYTKSRCGNGGDVIRVTSKNKRGAVDEQMMLQKEAHELQLKIKSIMPNKRRMDACVSLSPRGQMYMDRDWGKRDIYGSSAECDLFVRCPSSTARKMRKQLRASQWMVRHKGEDDLKLEKTIYFDIHEDWKTLKQRVANALEPFMQPSSTMPTECAPVPPE